MLSDFILNHDYGNASSALDYITNNDLSVLDETNRNMICFFKSGLLLISNEIEGVKQYQEQVTCAIFKEYIENLVLLSENPQTANLNYFVDANNEVFRIITLDILIINFQSSRIINELFLPEEPPVYELYLFCLAYFNIGNFEQALFLMEKAYKMKKEKFYYFWIVIIKITLLTHNNIFISNNDIEKIESLSMELSEVLEEIPAIKKEYKKLIDYTKIAILQAIGSESFLNDYDSLQEDFKKENPFLEILALYHQSNSDYEQAINAYLEADKNHEIIFRILFCYYLANDYDKLIEFYGTLTVAETSKKSSSLYLIALNEVNSNQFKAEFEKQLKEVKGIEDLYLLFDTTSGRLTEKKKIHDVLEKMDLQINEYPSNLVKLKFALLAYEVEDLILFKKIIFSLTLLENIELNKIYHIMEILKNPDLTIEIIDWLMKNGNYNFELLTFKFNAYSTLEMYAAQLDVLKELYKIRPTDEIVMRIVELINRDLNSSNQDYENYLSHIKKINSPTSLLILAQAQQRLGEIDNSLKSAYSAVFKDGCNETEWIYSGFVQLFLNTLDGNSSEYLFNTVTDEVVVKLQNEECGDQYICINQDNEYQLNINAVGALHVSKTDPIYLKLFNKELDGEISIDSVKYRIIEIKDKYVYAFHYTSSKVKRNSNAKGMEMITFDSSNPEEMVNQIMKMLPEPEDQQRIFDDYLSLDLGIGLAIENIVSSNYEKYSVVVNALLYDEDKQLYAGYLVPGLGEDDKIVLSLSTLIILQRMNLLAVLECISDILIPESLIIFVREMVIKTTNYVKRGTQTLARVGEGLIMLPADEELPIIWNEIHDKLQADNIRVKNVTMKRRNVYFGKYTMEDILERFNVAKFQLDSMVLAHDENAIYISDDYLLRRIASQGGIKNTNLISLLNLLDSTNGMEAYRKIAETNYSFVPGYSPKDALVHATEMVMKQVHHNHK